MVIHLERDTNDLLMVQLMPLLPIISCFIEIQNGLPFWCQLIQVVLQKACFTLSDVVVILMHQKGKTNLDLLEQEIVSDSGIRWAICKSAPRPS